MPSSHRHNRHDKTVLSVSCLVWRCELYDCSERVQTSDFLSATVLRCRGNPIHTADADATQTRQFCRVRRGAVNRLRCFHFAHCVPSSPTRRHILECIDLSDNVETYVGRGPGCPLLQYPRVASAAAISHGTDTRTDRQTDTRPTL